MSNFSLLLALAIGLAGCWDFEYFESITADAGIHGASSPCETARCIGASFSGGVVLDVVGDGSGGAFVLAQVGNTASIVDASNPFDPQNSVYLEPGHSVFHLNAAGTVDSTLVLPFLPTGLARQAGGLCLTGERLAGASLFGIPFSGPGRRFVVCLDSMMAGKAVVSWDGLASGKVAAGADHITIAGGRFGAGLFLNDAMEPIPGTAPEPGQDGGFVASFTPTFGLKWFRTIAAPDLTVERLVADSAGNLGLIAGGSQITFWAGLPIENWGGTSYALARIDAEGELKWISRFANGGRVVDAALVGPETWYTGLAVPKGGGVGERFIARVDLAGAVQKLLVFPAGAAVNFFALGALEGTVFLAGRTPIELELSGGGKVPPGGFVIALDDEGALQWTHLLDATSALGQPRSSRLVVDGEQLWAGWNDAVFSLPF